METFKEKLARVLAEDVNLVPFDHQWKGMFEEEKSRLWSLFSKKLISRIEHFGSTAIPGVCAKPIVDMLVEVACLKETRKKIAPILEGLGYDYFWRPTWGDDTPPFYAWFIKRDQHQKRTHHIHMVESGFEHWERLLFRDFLIENRAYADKYDSIKKDLARRYRQNRVAYANAKSDFITRVTKIAKLYYRNG